MDDIVTEKAGSILRALFNRPNKQNAMTSAMYSDESSTNSCPTRMSWQATETKIAREAERSVASLQEAHEAIIS